jgi:hypothetical protein
MYINAQAESQQVVIQLINYCRGTIPSQSAGFLDAISVAWAHRSGTEDPASMLIPVFRDDGAAPGENGLPMEIGSFHRQDVRSTMQPIGNLLGTSSHLERYYLSNGYFCVTRWL